MANEITAPKSWDSNGESNYTPITGHDAFGDTTYVGFQDTNGNIWNSMPTLGEEGWTQPKLLLSGEVANDPYIGALGLARQDPAAAQALYDLKQSNPKEFYKQAASQLENQIYTNYGMNMNYGPQYDLLQSLKQTDPASYYENQLKFLGQQVGWQIGQNRGDRNPAIIEQIKGLIPEAQAAGLTPDQINSVLGNSVNQANMMNQQRIANEAASGSGSFWKENLPGIAFVGSAALGMNALGGALAGGAAAAEGAGTAAELAGPTYGELGYTGLEAGQMGPTYADMGYTGLNQGQAIAAADAAAKGMSLSDALSYANKARQAVGLGSTIAKMVGGGNSGTQGGGVNTQQLANLLKPAQYQGIELAQIQPKNPFLFDTPGQTQATQGVYDVSGSNLANALRKR